MNTTGASAGALDPSASKSPKPAGVYQSALRRTGTYFMATLAKRFVSFLLLPLYTRFLTPGDYGVLELLSLMYLLFSTLVGMQFSNSLYYFYFRAETREAQDAVVSNAFAGAALLGLITATLGWFLAPVLSTAFFKSDAYAPAVRVILAGYAFALPLEMASAYLRALDRAGAYVVLSVLQLIVQIAANIFFIVYWRMGFMGALWGQFTAVALVGPSLTCYLLSKVRLSFSTVLFRQFLRYSAPFTLGGFAMTIVHSGDRWFLQRFASLSDVGIYALAYNFGMLIESLLTPFATYWTANMFDIVKKQDGERHYARFCTYVALTLSFAVVGLTAFVRPVLSVVVTPAFQAAATYVPWLAFAYVLRAIDQHLRGVFRLEAKTGREARVLMVGGITSLIAYAALIPPFRLWGGVIATNLGFGVMLMYGFREAQRVRRFPFEYLRVAQIGITTIGIILLSYVLRPASFLQQILVGVLLVALFPLVLYIAGFVQPGERRALRELRMRIMRTRSVLQAVEEK